MSAAGQDGGADGLDEEAAAAMASQLVEFQQHSGGSGRKQSRKQLLEWMLANERDTIDVGAGMAAVEQKPETIAANDLLALTLGDEPYRWSVEQIDDLIQLMNDTKERIANPKPVLKIKLKRKSKAKGKRGRAKAQDDDDDENEAGAPIAPRAVAKEKRGRANTMDDDGDEDNADAAEAEEAAARADEKKSEESDGEHEGLELAVPKSAVYGREMDTEDIVNGRSRPNYQFVDALGPLRLPKTKPAS
jgi:hypothetical protein